jgi:hypothetical protein
VGDGINANTQQSNGKTGGWRTMQQEGAANIMARRKGRTMQDKQVMEKGTMQGNWVGDDTTRGGGWRTQYEAIERRLTQQEGGWTTRVVDSFWWWRWTTEHGISKGNNKGGQ